MAVYYNPRSISEYFEILNRQREVLDAYDKITDPVQAVNYHSEHWDIMKAQVNPPAANALMVAELAELLRRADLNGHLRAAETPVNPKEVSPVDRQRAVQLMREGHVNGTVVERLHILEGEDDHHWLVQALRDHRVHEPIRPPLTPEEIRERFFEYYPHAREWWDSHIHPEPHPSPDTALSEGVSLAEQCHKAARDLEKFIMSGDDLRLTHNYALSLVNLLQTSSDALAAIHDREQP